jgi:hypothetical protein
MLEENLHKTENAQILLDSVINRFKCTWKDYVILARNASQCMHTKLNHDTHFIILPLVTCVLQ